MKMESKKRAASKEDLELFKEALSYDAETGIFRWKINSNKVKIGDIAGTDSNQYRVVKHKNITFYLHRLAWAIVHGWPENQIDHIDGDGKNNKLSNLRECDSKQNGQNRKLNSNNKTGYHGVYFDTRRGCYTVSIRANGKQLYLGGFKDIEQARAAYLSAKLELHTFNPEVRA